MHSWSPECAQWCAIRLRRFLFCDMSLLQNHNGPSRRHRVVQSLFTPIVAMGINSFVLDGLLPAICDLFERTLKGESRTAGQLNMPPCIAYALSYFATCLCSESQGALQSQPSGANLSPPSPLWQ